MEERITTNNIQIKYSQFKAVDLIVPASNETLYRREVGGGDDGGRGAGTGQASADQAGREQPDQPPAAVAPVEAVGEDHGVVGGPEPVDVGGVADDPGQDLHQVTLLKHPEPRDTRVTASS